MTDEGGLEPSAGLDPRRLLVDWANGQDGWVRRLVAMVLATRRPAGDVELEDLFRMYLAEKGLAGPSTPAEPAPELPYPTDGATAAADLRLLRLSDVVGVNAITPGSEIAFCEGLTILYGENGTGKTGYARILKRLAAVRDPEEILPNIFGTAAAVPSATLTYRLGEDEYELRWSNEVGVSPFTRMNIFDSPAVNLRVDENLAYVYTPAEISLFEYVTAGIRGVQERGTRAVAELSPTTNPFLRYFQRGTTVYQQIEALGPATEIAALEALAVPPPDALTEKEKLEREVAALASNVAEGILASHREAVRVLQLLSQAAEAASRFDPTTFNEQVAALDALRESYRRVREDMFASGELPGPPDDEWQRFVTAADRYKSHLALGDYPHEDDVCLYCRQPLSSEAVTLIRKYAAFLDDALVREITAQERTVDGLAVGLDMPGTSDLEAAIRRLRDAGASEPVYEIGERLVTMLVSVREATSNLRRVTDTEVGSVAEAVRASVDTPLLAHQGEVDSLQRQLEDRETALQIAQGKLRDLTATIELERHLPEIKVYVANAKRAAALQQVLRRMQGLLRSLTETSKTASEDLVNRDFESRFQEECVALRTPAVRLEFIGREGRAQRRKTLSADYRLSKILSEGEQKVLALADFIAEARMGDSAAPIIFDDPVNSLDHRRLQEVADRMARLVDTRQVVVFTHNIWLATELLARFEKRGGECSYFLVSDDETRRVKGRVDTGTGPRWDTVKELAKRVEEHLQAAEGASGETQRALIDAAYGEMRSWCEVVVEEVLFADVARRYRANIMMGGLKNIKADRLPKAIDTINGLFERACRFIPDHSQPLATLSARPSPADARADWREAQEAVKAYRRP